MTKASQTHETITDADLDDISGGPIFVKIAGVPGDVKATSFDPVLQPAPERTAPATSIGIETLEIAVEKVER